MHIDFKKIDKPYLIAELGCNFSGDFQMAKRLIDASYASFWDCVKFQKRDPDVCVPEDQKNKIKSTPWGDMTYLEYRKFVEFEKLEYDYINQYCNEKPIDWTASVWDTPSVMFMLDYDVPFIKVPSAHLTNDILLCMCGDSGTPILLSTGMSTIEEIDHAVDILEKTKCNYALTHCNSSYPAADEELNLRCIETLIKKYDCPIGYSGHEFGVHIMDAAIVLGAKIIEKHITIDRNSWGTDQSNSIEVDDMWQVKKAVDRLSCSLGDGKKIVYESEMPHREKLRGAK